VCVDVCVCRCVDVCVYVCVYLCVCESALPPRCLPIALLLHGCWYAFMFCSSSQPRSNEIGIPEASR
jgi:hypothetical protein